MQKRAELRETLRQRFQQLCRRETSEEGGVPPLTCRRHRGRDARQDRRRPGRVFLLHTPGDVVPVTVDGAEGP